MDGKVRVKEKISRLEKKTGIFDPNPNKKHRFGSNIPYFCYLLGAASVDFAKEGRN